jgi:hypothetical protein
MDEREKILLMWVTLSFVEDIRDGKGKPTPSQIKTRLHSYEKSIDQQLTDKGSLKINPEALVRAKTPRSG